jgi:hypothetical protein
VLSANLTPAKQKQMAAAVVQLSSSVLIWHMIDWFSTSNGLLHLFVLFTGHVGVICYMGEQKAKSEETHYAHAEQPTA